MSLPNLDNLIKTRQFKIETMNQHVYAAHELRTYGFDASQGAVIKLSGASLGHR